MKITAKILGLTAVVSGVAIYKMVACGSYSVDYNNLFNCNNTPCTYQTCNQDIWCNSVADLKHYACGALLSAYGVPVYANVSVSLYSGGTCTVYNDGIQSYSECMGGTNVNTGTIYHMIYTTYNCGG